MRPAFRARGAVRPAGRSAVSRPVACAPLPSGRRCISLLIGLRDGRRGLFGDARRQPARRPAYVTGTSRRLRIVTPICNFLVRRRPALRVAAFHSIAAAVAVAAAAFAFPCPVLCHATSRRVASHLFTGGKTRIEAMRYGA